MTEMTETQKKGWRARERSLKYSVTRAPLPDGVDLREADAYQREQERIRAEARARAVTRREERINAKLAHGQPLNAIERRIVGNNPDNYPAAWDWGDEGEE